ncbi:MAG: amidohydrolase family protein [Acutalibacteraceae bacterium]|nr:amidohydrolase family protein [Acutalibacteraceae bacterium]
MVIDFHTHVYPDKIAEKTIEKLKASAPGVKVYTKGTLESLRESMKNSDIDKSVILPVATRAGQFDTINRFAQHINNKYNDLISFGGIHPLDENPEEKLLQLKQNGFKGVKIHPDYTGTFIDDEHYITILTLCGKIGLTVVTHAGVDPAFDVVHCPPEKARNVLERVNKESGAKEPFIVFAHLGGIYSKEDVAKYLLGSNCYIDISCSFASLGSWCNTDDEDVIRVIKAHGAEKILFATDSPWNDQRSYAEHFKALDGISDEEKQLILYKNAQKLLS